MTGRVHIVGGGLAGLSCAIAAAKKNIPVTIYEATRRAGGRCRSFHDQDLDRVLDNGSHVVLAGNPSVFEYLSLVGASNELVPSGTNKEVSFVDLKSNQKWNLKPSQGRLPFFLLSSQRRPPQTHLWQYATALGLIAKADKATVSDILGKTGIAWNSFWEPLSVAIMNTNPDEASAFLLGSALKRTLLSRNGGIQSFVPRESLSKTFVEPALNKIKELGGSIRFDCPLTHLEVKSKAKALIFRDQTIELAPMDIVVLAIPPWAPAIQPYLPRNFSPTPSPIINCHFQLCEKVIHPSQSITALIGGRAQWLFKQPGLISATVSADQELPKWDKEDIAKVLWKDIQACFNWHTQPQPLHRIIIEKRATPIQDIGFAETRPTAITYLDNVLLAGDWTATKLPCSIESAILSGFRTARLALTRI